MKARKKVLRPESAAKPPTRKSTPVMKLGVAALGAIVAIWIIKVGTGDNAGPIKGADTNVPSTASATPLPLAAPPTMPIA